MIGVGDRQSDGGLRMTIYPWGSQRHTGDTRGLLSLYPIPSSYTYDQSVVLYSHVCMFLYYLLSGVDLCAFFNVKSYFCMICYTWSIPTCPIVSAPLVFLILYNFFHAYCILLFLLYYFFSYFSLFRGCFIPHTTGIGVPIVPMVLKALDVCF